MQDVRVRTPTLQTESYHWFTSVTNAGSSRISGFLLRRTLQAEIQHVIITPDIQTLFLRIHGCSLILVNIYMPCNETPGVMAAYQTLHDHLDRLKTQLPGIPYFVCGDTNAHLASDLLEQEIESVDQRLLGPYLYHTESNDSGNLLWALMRDHHLAAVTTILDSSTLKTRYQSGHSSQLDHLLAAIDYFSAVSQLKGSWTSISDHKLITAQLRLRNVDGK